MHVYYIYILLQGEMITISEQPKITLPSDTQAILKHVSCHDQYCFFTCKIPMLMYTTYVY